MAVMGASADTELYRWGRKSVKESAIQDAIMCAIGLHPLVAWAHVTTSGKVKGRGGHWMTLGFPGLADIIGQLKDGRVLAIEVKDAKGKATKDQDEFLTLVRQHNGVAGVARSVEDALRIVGED